MAARSLDRIVASLCTGAKRHGGGGAHDEGKESEKNVQERDGETEKAGLLVRGPIVEDFSRKEFSVRGFESRREACAAEVFRFDVEGDRERDGEYLRWPSENERE